MEPIEDMGWCAGGSSHGDNMKMEDRVRFVNF